MTDDRRFSRLEDIEQERRLTRLEDQVARLVSDAESEKETGRRVSEDWTKRFDVLVTGWGKNVELLDLRIRVLEKHMYIAAGFIAALQVVLKVFLP